MTSGGYSGAIQYHEVTGYFHLDLHFIVQLETLLLCKHLPNCQIHSVKSMNTAHGV